MARTEVEALRDDVSIVAQVLLALDALIDTFLLVLRVYGQQFLAFMLEALEKPWLVKR